MPSKTPYITASALIRYCDARAPERTRIIRDFRDSEFPPFKGWYGGETEGAIRRYLATGGADPEPLDSLESLLIKRESFSDHDEAKVQGQLHALEAMRGTNLSAITALGLPSVIDDKIGPLFISGVRVSVRPTNMLTATKEGQKSLAVGVVKPYLASTDPLTKETALLYAALLHWYAEETLAHIGEAERRLCFVIDVFKQQVVQAPSAFKQRRELLRHSCQEIAERWYAIPDASAGSKGASA